MPGQPLKLTLTKVNLDEKFPEEAQIAKRVGEAILSIGGIAPIQSPVVSNAGSFNPNVKPYYSPLLCKACHEKQYNDWTQTKHSHALKTLVDAKQTTPDCLPCHSEVFRAAQRYSRSRISPRSRGGVRYVPHECLAAWAGAQGHGGSLEGRSQNLP